MTKRMVITTEIFNQQRFRLLQNKAAGLKEDPKKMKIWYSYPYFTKRFSKLKNFTPDDVLYAIHVAYSWMPTMLDIYSINEPKDLRKLVPLISMLRKIHSYSGLVKQETDVIAALDQLSQVINHSIVGLSKVLHFFSPDYIPIIDSRVIREWNIFFRTEPQILLKGAITSAKYLDYWKALLFWKKQTGLRSIRELEKPFFLLGRKASGEK